MGAGRGASTVIPASLSVISAPLSVIPAPPPSFRRRLESRTPAGSWRSDGRRWIPAFAGMTDGWGGNDEWVGGNDGVWGMALADVAQAPSPLPAGEG